MKIIECHTRVFFSSNKHDRRPELAINNKICLIAIDEAHLVFD